MPTECPQPPPAAPRATPVARAARGAQRTRAASAARFAAAIAALTTLTTLTTGPALAGEPSHYQLRLSDPGAYRLQTPAPADPAPLLLSPQLGIHQRRAAEAITRAARAADLDPALLHAVAQTESGYDAHARSPKGAVGLLQLMPATAAEHGVTNPLDPDQNALGGARYLKALLDQFDGRTDLALAAYNAGPGAVRRHDNQIPPYPETRRYVPAVLARAAAARPKPHSPYVAGYRQEAGGLAAYRVSLPLASLAIRAP